MVILHKSAHDGSVFARRVLVLGTDIALLAVHDRLARADDSTRLLALREFLDVVLHDAIESKAEAGRNLRI